jgi:hypothetical protein
VFCLRGTGRAAAGRPVDDQHLSGQASSAAISSADTAGAPAPSSTTTRASSPPPHHSQCARSWLSNSSADPSPSAQCCLSSADTAEAKGRSIEDESHLKVALLPYPPMAHPKRIDSGPAFVDSANFAVAQLGLSVAKVPTGAAMLTLLLIKQSPHQLMLVTRGASAMVAVPTGVPSARTVALVLAVLGYRRRLRRRDRWSRSALLAHQDRALRRLREHAYQKSRFYQDFHAGLASAPLSALPVLTKQMLIRLRGHPSRSAACRC